MIHVKLINKTITAEDAMLSPVSPETQALFDKAIAISKTPEWQAHLLGLHEKERKREFRVKKKKSQKRNIPKLRKTEGVCLKTEKR